MGVGVKISLGVGERSWIIVGLMDSVGTSEGKGVSVGNKGTRVVVGKEVGVIVPSGVGTLVNTGVGVKVSAEELASWAKTKKLTGKIK